MITNISGRYIIFEVIRVVSSQTDTSHTMNIAMAYIRSGDTLRARQLLWQVVSSAPHYAQAWLLLARVARTPEEKRAALHNTLTYNPHHTTAEQSLRRLLAPQYVRQAVHAGIFINYARADELFAVELAEDLRNAGIRVWVDVLDMARGEDWYEAIEAALRRCSLMLLIVSPSTARAASSRAELMRFMDAGKIVIPALRYAGDLNGLNLYHPPIDFSQNYHTGLENLLHLLLLPKSQPATSW
ncbi:MAG: TIR domain-containing protein [Anaerolineae bacterium]|nr:TIR domain-containing protein [Anaerolineae bacterium]